MECISNHISLEAFEDAPFSSCNPSIFQTLSGTFEVGTNGNLPISPEVGRKVGANGNLPIFPEVGPEVGTDSNLPMFSEVGPEVGTNGNLSIFPEVGHPLSEMFDDMVLLHLNCLCHMCDCSKGVGKISASGGTGWGGGGGGRASIECLEYESTMVLIHGWWILSLSSHLPSFQTCCLIE
jgi:hypothetical protein